MIANLSCPVTIRSYHVEQKLPPEWNELVAKPDFVKGLWPGILFIILIGEE